MHAHDRTLIASLGFNDPDKKDPRHDLACQYLATEDVTTRLVATFIGPDLVERPETSSERCGYDNNAFVKLSRGTCSGKVTQVGPYRSEVIVNKGEGKYQTTVGFLDLLIPARVEYTIIGKTTWTERRYYSTDRFGRRLEPVEESKIKSEIQILTYKETGSYQNYNLHPDWPVAGIEDVPRTEPYCHKTFEDFRLVIEVKIGTVGVGDMIRQVNLYRQHLQDFPRYKNRWIVATAFRMSRSDLDMFQNEEIYHVRLGPGFEAWVAEQKRLGDRPPAPEDEVMF